MLTSAGSGYSRWRDLAVTRWREDVTRDDTGSYIFLRDVASGAVWSAGFQPSGVEAEAYQVTFTEDRAEFIRTDGAITTILEIVVSPEDDAEVRRLSIANGGHRDREIEVTSYLELVLAPPAADAAHQTFSKLFVQTEYVAKRNTLLATRRKRAPEEPDIWAAHHAVLEGTAAGRAGNRNRSGTISGSRTRNQVATCRGGWPAVVGYRRNGLGSRVCASIPDESGRRHDLTHCLLDRRRSVSRGAHSTCSISTTRRTLSRARRRSPGRRLRCSCVI